MEQTKLQLFLNFLRHDYMLYLIKNRFLNPLPKMRRQDLFNVLRICYKGSVIFPIITDYRVGIC